MAGPRKVHKGQRLAGYPGDAHNAFVDATRKINQTPPPVVQPRPSSGPDEQVQVLVQNKTGAALTERFPILRLTDPIATPADITDAAQVVLRGVQFEGDAPDADTGANFVVMQGPCGVDQFRPATLLGATWCKVDIQAEEDTHVTSVDGDSDKLISGTTGHRILYKPSGTGVQLCIVMLGGGSAGGPKQIIATETISGATYGSGTITPSTFTARLVKGSPSDGYTHSTDDEIECFNASHVSVSITAGFARYGWVSDANELITIDCEEFEL